MNWLPFLIAGFSTSQTTERTFVESIVARPQGGYFATRRIPREAKQELVSFDGRRESAIEIEPLEQLVGVSSDGRAMLWTPKQTIRVANASSATWAPEAPVPLDYVFRGAWRLEQRARDLLLSKFGRDLSIVDEVLPDDAYAVDEKSGEVAVVRLRNGVVALDRYRAGGKPLGKRRITVAGMIVDSGFPDCAAVYLSPGRLICTLNLRRKSSESAARARPAICVVSLSSGRATPIRGSTTFVGDLPQPFRRGFDLLKDGRIALVERGRIVFFRIPKVLDAI